MATGDFPHITSSAYSTSTYTPMAMGLVQVGNTAGLGEWGDTSLGWDALGRRIQAPFVSKPLQQNQSVETDVADKKQATRFVRVLIVDPDDNLKLEDRLIYKGEEKLTDLTDQELFFELDIRDLLKAHNEKRVKVVNKTVKERTEFLEEAKIRDLRMVVTTIASF